MYVHSPVLSQKQTSIFTPFKSRREPSRYSSSSNSSSCADTILTPLGAFTVTASPVPNTRPCSCPYEGGGSSSPSS